MTSFAIIAAMARDRIIGRDNDMPWPGRFKKDLVRFQKLTKNKPVIMGRPTHLSIGMVLPSRSNIVVTRQTGWQSPFPYDAAKAALYIEHDLKAAFHRAKSLTDDEAMIIGGADIYAQALPFCSRLYLTELDFTVPGDTRTCKHFPNFDAADWVLTASESLIDGADAMRFLRYDRKTPVMPV